MGEQIVNIYCDESCHLLEDGHEVMTLGALWCPLEKRLRMCRELRELKHRHGIPPSTEVKWIKVSPAKLDFYLSWIDHFFDQDDLRFRAVVILEKTGLRHASYQQSHDDWYYKMLWLLISRMLSPERQHCIYLDIKDTHSGEKARKLHEVLCTSQYDFKRSIIKKVQSITSHESELLQLCDLLIGAIGYLNRGQQGSQAKLRVVERIKERSGLSLKESTLIGAQKVNLFFWKGAQSSE